MSKHENSNSQLGGEAVPAPPVREGNDGGDDSGPLPADAGLVALCAIARLHPVAADPVHLAHQLAMPPEQPAPTTELLLAAKHLGLRARYVRVSIQRLPTS